MKKLCKKILSFFKNNQESKKPNVDLSTCKEGDILISSQGSRLEYVSPTPWGRHKYLDHVVKYVQEPNGIPFPPNSYGTRTNDGYVYANNRIPETDHDIVKIIKKNEE